MTAAGDCETCRSRARLSKHRRVRKRGDFLVAQRTGRRVQSSHFVLVVAAQPPGRPEQGAVACGAARLGLVVSRKVGRAAARNRVKRLVREWFRHRWAGVPDGVDLLIIAKVGAAGLRFAGLAAELDVTLPRVRRLAARIQAQPAAPPADPG